MNDTLRISFTDSNTSAIYGGKLFQKIAFGCLLSSLSIFTVCGNILVLYAIQTEKKLRTVSNLFILSLALADLAVGLFVMPLSAATIIAGRWPFASVICKMWLSIDYVARYFKRKKRLFKSKSIKRNEHKFHVNTKKYYLFIFCFVVLPVYLILFFSVLIVIGLLFIRYVIFKNVHVDEQQYLFLLLGLYHHYGHQQLYFGHILHLNIVIL
jgi:hypothetical protein